KQVASTDATSLVHSAGQPPSRACPTSALSSTSTEGTEPERSQLSRARSTGSPCATTNPIAASRSAMPVRYCGASIDGQRRVDVLDPGHHAALDVHGV